MRPKIGVNENYSLTLLGAFALFYSIIEYEKTLHPKPFALFYSIIEYE